MGLQPRPGGNANVQMVREFHATPAISAWPSRAFPKSIGGVGEPLRHNQPSGPSEFELGRGLPQELGRASIMEESSGVCSRISAALSCDTVKTRFSGSGGAGRSPARKFYGQALFSRQNLHAIRPTAPRWIVLIETCTKHAKQGECGAARGLQERTCLRNAVATAMDARSCGSSRPDAKHSSSTAALVQYACTRKTRTAPPCSHAGQGRCALQ